MMLARLARGGRKLAPVRGFSAYLGPLADISGINAKVVNAEYAVRGALVVRAEAIEQQLKAGTRTDIDKVIYCNIGNPQALRQQPLSFVRAVLAAATNPCPKMHDALPRDAVARANEVVGEVESIGAYSNSKGVPGIRRRIAAALLRRDGWEADPEAIFLTNGASQGVAFVLEMLVRGADDGVLVPTPQYPLYSASMTLLGGKRVPYYLDEKNAWTLHVEDLEAQVKAARQSGTKVRAIVVINPGNPTGQSLTRRSLEDIVHFAERENLAILADEVYQKNVYDDTKPFVSFKKVVRDLKSPVELVSLHSTSKGVFGECGLRGGYLEAVNFGKDAMDQLYKMASISLCANLIGQVAVDVMMTPPIPGDESYTVYEEQTKAIYDSMRRRASYLAKALNGFEGVSCQNAEGAMYLFPTNTIPPGAIKEAEMKGMLPDQYYCLELLEQTGVCLVPGSGFGQKEGTFHFRTTILPPEEEIDVVVDKMSGFHAKFMERFA